MNVPNFLKLENESLLYNGAKDSVFVFYVPEVFFNGKTKTAIAEIIGEYVSMIGVCYYAMIDANGRRGEVKPFTFPTMFLCKPREIEKIKQIKIGNDKEPNDYRALKFYNGDEIVSSTRVPQLIDNVEMLFKIAVITAKLPSISYEEGWKLFQESARLNGFNFKLNSQLFGILWSTVCRDPNDITRPFRYTDMKDMYGYNLISIKQVPKFISPFSSIISEGWDEGVMAGISMSDDNDKFPESPIEKVIMQ